MTAPWISSNPREDKIMSVPNLVGHGFMTFGSAWVEPVEIKGALSLKGFG
jgi:hypothetical protein